MGRIVMCDADCADCLCRVCARNADNDSFNPNCDYPDYPTCHCDCIVGKNELVETQEDCPLFLPDISEG